MTETTPLALQAKSAVPSRACGANNFDVTLQIKAKHADLWAAACKLGSVKALADAIGMDQSTVGQWIALRAVPNFTRPQSKLGNPERRKMLEMKLFELTGKTVDELWPPAVREQDFLNLPKTTEITRSADVRGLALYQEEILSLPLPDAVAEKLELTEQIETVLKSLTFREREIVKKRYGLCGEFPMTLEEIGKGFLISKDRVRQIEAKAIRKMQHPKRSGKLKEFAGIIES
jgi:RNA polymerase sigma factor (sigma-70 family)